MLVGRIVLENVIVSAINKFKNNKKFLDLLGRNMMFKHNFLSGNINDLIAGKLYISELSVPVLLWLCLEINNVSTELNQNIYINVSSYFTPKEIKEFSNSKLDKMFGDTEYPLTIDNVIEVNNDQWITAKPVEFIKELRDKKLIRYNPKTQRKLAVKKSNDDIQIYTVKIRKSTINGIRELMLDGKFISNTITLNINQDNSENDFDYVNNKLVLKNGYFDITDGFHRYIVMTDLKDIDEDFKYNTELRITNFSEEKANFFTYQEGQATRIGRSELAPKNKNNLNNLVVDKLNEDFDSYLRDKIGTDKTSLIKYNYLSELIASFYNIKTRTDVIRAYKSINQTFEKIIYYDTHLLENKIPDMVLAAIIYISQKYKIDEVIDMYQMAESMMDKEFKVKSVNNALTNQVSRILRG